MIEALILYIAEAPLSVTIPITIGATVFVSFITTYVANELFTYRDLALNNDLIAIKFGYFGGIFAVSLGLALIGSYGLYVDVREVSSNEVSALRSLYYSAREEVETPTREGKGIMRKAIIDYAQSVVEDEWAGQARSKSSSRTTSRLTELYDAFIMYGDKNLINASYANWLGEVVKMRGLRTTTSTRTVAEMVWVVLFAGVLLSLLVPLFIGVQNFVVHLLISTLFSTFVMLHLLAIVYLAHPFTGDIAVTASTYVDFIREAKDLGE